VEADLARWYNIDYRDRWRGDLTLRRLLVLIRYLPDESALSTLMRKAPAWSVEAHLLDELRIAIQGRKGKPHPARPRGQRRRLTPERLKKIAESRRRAAARRRAIESGEIT
jgi:hypothetical protein